MWIFLNDRFVRQEEAVISVFDHGFLYGDGVYETLRAYDGHIFMLPQHLARLQRSATLIDLKLPIPETQWPALLNEAMMRNNVRDAYLRVTVSRGEGDIGLDPGLCPRPTLVIMAKPLTHYPTHFFEDGVSLAVVQVRRNHPAALSPQIKSLNFLNNILAKQEASKRGAFDGLMLNAGGEITECTTSNVFFVRTGRLCTPSVESGILDGITREVILALGRENGLPVEEARYTPEALLSADECFLTNTTMEVMPVSTIDRRPIGPGTPGKVTRLLRESFQSHLPHWLS